MQKNLMIKKMIYKVVGVEITLILKYVHPAKLVAKEFLHKNSIRNLEKAVLIRRGKRVFNKKEQMCMLFFTKKLKRRYIL